MEKTPKLQKRTTLSLGGRFNKKRHSESPQSHVRAVYENATKANDCFISKDAETPRSPSVISISSDCGIECTPPHRKFNLDDSIDYSQQPFDSSFSPSALLSQTLGIDSPEVGWRWAKRSNTRNMSNNVTTPDSAYAADSSSSSAAGSSSKNRENAACTRSETQQRLSNELKRDEYRKAYEIELRRAEKTKADELLKKRCARFQEQLKEAQLKSSNAKEKNVIVNNNEKKIIASPPSNKFTIFCHEKQEHQQKQEIQQIHQQQKQIFDIKSQANKNNDTLDDFFNDSDIDGFLIEATQQCESKIVELTPKTATNKEHSINEPNSTPKTVATPTTAANTEKRTSFYMKFLEDDLHDDWLVSLDEEVLQATQAKKQRTSLQRYKSMPTDSTTNVISDTIATSTTRTAASVAAKTTKQMTNMTSSTYAGSTPKFKRHASSHAISPNAANYRGRERKH